MTANKKIPALRFKEFEGEWVSIKFGTVILNNTYGPRFSGEDYNRNGNVKTIRGTDISIEGEILYNQVPIAKLPNDFIKNHILKEGDLVMMTTADCGLTAVFREQNFDFIPGAYSVKLTLNNEASPYYFKYVFQRSASKYEVSRFIRKATVANLPCSDILNFKFFISHFEEQQKIASFLTAIDDKIQQLTKKKALLEQFKKGAMQQIFNQQIRFKDDDEKDYPDWEEKKLGEIGVTYNGLTGKTKEHFGTGKPFVTYKQIFDNSKIDTTKFELVEINENENQNIVRHGDVFFTTSSETSNEVGFSSVLLEKVENLYLNSFCFGYRVHSLNILIPEYSRYLFRSEEFRKDIIKLAQGSTRFNMSKIQFLKAIIHLPVKEEQQKIANFLTGIDNKINAVGRQLEQTQVYKKGLLQQMFI